MNMYVLSLMEGAIASWLSSNKAAPQCITTVDIPEVHKVIVVTDGDVGVALGGWRNDFDAATTIGATTAMLGVPECGRLPSRVVRIVNLDVGW